MTRPQFLLAGYNWLRTLLNTMTVTLIASLDTSEHAHTFHLEAIAILLQKMAAKIK